MYVVAHYEYMLLINVYDITQLVSFFFIIYDYINFNEYKLLFLPQVSLDSRVREVINRNMVEPTPHTFDEAQLQIWTLMHRDSYPRFLNSQMYKRLLQQLS